MQQPPGSNPRKANHPSGGDTATRELSSESSKANGWLQKAEWAVAGVVTVFLALCHVTFARGVGGLWRDEVNSVSVAHLPTISEIWKNLQFDSFPMFWFLVLRGWSALGLGNDGGYRLLGCIVGLLLVGAIWFTARRFKTPAPLFSLFLLGANTATIVRGDSMRAYGMGAVLALFMIGAMWRVTKAPTRWNIVLAAITALASVQTLYYNAVLLLAVCCGGFAVTLRSRAWKPLAILLGVGLLAAISMVPYAGPLKAATDWNIIVRMDDCSFSWLWDKCSDTLGSSTPEMTWVWFVLLAAALSLGLAVQLMPVLRVTREQKDFALFGVTTLLVGVVGYFCFLKLLRYPTQHWYYLTLMTLVAVFIDGLLWILANNKAWRVIRLGALLILAASLGNTWDNIDTRLTDLDLVAEYLNKNAAKGDVIVLDRHYKGITFKRYYTGEASWTTTPPISFYGFHRYDLLKEQMIATSQTGVVQPVLAKIAEALQSGKKVWLIGNVYAMFNFKEPVILEPAPSSEVGWSDDMYCLSWNSQIGCYLQHHAKAGSLMTIPLQRKVNVFESNQLFRLDGWTEGQQPR